MHYYYFCDYYWLFYKHPSTWIELYCEYVLPLWGGNSLGKKIIFSTFFACSWCRKSGLKCLLAINFWLVFRMKMNRAKSFQAASYRLQIPWSMADNVSLLWHNASESRRDISKLTAEIAFIYFWKVFKVKLLDLIGKNAF